MPSGKRPPGPGPFVTSLRFSLYSRDRIGYLSRLAARYGDIVTARRGREPVIFINHPDFIRDVLVTRQGSFHKGKALQRAKKLLGNGLLTSEGDEHLRQRRLIQPAFHRERIFGYGSIATIGALNLQKEWKTGQTVDIAAEMFRLTLRVVGQTLFGADLEEDTEAIAEAWEVLISNFLAGLAPFGPIGDLLPLPANFRFRSARKRLDTIIYRLIYAHGKSPAGRTDLLSLLIAASDDQNQGKSMTPRQVRDEALTILMAGHETTANALTWTWVLLSQYPEIRDKLNHEISYVVGDRLPTCDDLPHLVYARRIVQESLRLFPPAWAIGRRAVSDVEIGGYEIRKGSVVLMSQAVTHRDRRWFPEPDAFDPDRWLPQVEETRPKFAYFPFGGGPRVCIGEQFGMMETILLMVTLAQRWKITLAPNAKIGTDPGITLRPKPGLLMTLEARPSGPVPQYVTL